MYHVEATKSVSNKQDDCMAVSLLALKLALALFELEGYTTVVYQETTDKDHAACFCWPCQVYLPKIPVKEV